PRTQDIHPDHVHWDQAGVTGTVNGAGLILRGFVPRTTVKEVTGNGNLVFQASTHKRWRLTGISGTFQVNETITGSSGGSGTVQAYSTEDNDVIQFTVSSGSFSSSDTITGGTSGATATLDSETNLNA